MGSLQNGATKNCSVSLPCFYNILLITLHTLHLPTASGQSPTFACDTTTNASVGNLGFCDTSKSIEDRVGDLVGRLTLEEKIGYLRSGAVSVDRLGIPKYEWWSEALHGVSNVGPGTRFANPVPAATSFPQVISTAASFNVTLFQAIGKDRSIKNFPHLLLISRSRRFWTTGFGFDDMVKHSIRFSMIRKECNSKGILVVIHPEFGGNVILDIVDSKSRVKRGRFRVRHGDLCDEWSRL